MDDPLLSVRKALDLGAWKHSWHNPLQTQEQRKEAVGTLEDMVRRRVDDIVTLRNAIDRLMEFIED